MTTNPTELAPVTQADRDAAAEYLREAGIEIGQITMHWTATAFARHRISHTPAPVEGVVERARELLAAELEADNMPNAASFVRDGHENASFGASAALRAIERALSDLEEANTQIKLRDAWIERQGQQLAAVDLLTTPTVAPAPVVERVARAIDPDDWRIIDHWAGVTDPDCRVAEYREKSMARATAALKSSGLDGAIEALERVINVVGNLKSSGKRLSHVVPELGAAVQAARTTLANLRGQKS